MPVFNNALAGAAGQAGGAAADLEIERSVRLSKEDGAHFSKTFSTAGNQHKWTWACWIKRTAMTNNGQSLFSVYTGANSDAGYLNLHFNGSNNLDMGGWHTNYFRTNRVFRDPTAWMHICVAYDRSLAESNRIRVYINGVRETSFDNYNASPTATYPLNSASLHNVGANAYYTNNDGKLGAGLADVHFVDGGAPSTATDNAAGAVTGIANAEYLTDFGKFDTTTGVWNPKAYSGSYGTNGFYFKFADNSSDAALGTDSSGNNNTWAVNNIASGATVANKGFDCFTYTGTNATQAFTNLAFQPDFLWFKSTSRQDSYGLYDVVRGRASNLYSDLNHSVNTSATSADLVSFNSNGFTLGQVQQTALNRNNEDYVVWAWKAGGSPTTLNTGSISASVSANTAYGFSIVKYTGDGTTNASVAHGLGSTPKMVIVKNLATGDWKVRHTSLASTYMATLNENYLANTASWNGETSSVFYPARSGDNYLNANTEEYIAYCWSEIPGFSKFGSWAGTGNGGSSGPVITLGFKPRWVLFKRTDQSGDNWTIFDTARDSGTLNMGLQPNVDLDEQNFGNREILVSDTGFQVRSTGSSSNQSGGTYIYAAFAEGDSSVIDSLIDSPTNYEADSGNNGGNYCTLNPLDKNTATLSNGNLQAQVDTDGARFVRGTIAVSSGKWYWECTTLSGTSMALGVVETTGTGNLTHSQSYYYYGHSGALYGNQSGVNGSWGGSQLAVGTVLGVALDMDNGTLKYYKNGSLIGTAWTGLQGKLVAPAVGNGGGGPNITAFNFGQRPFSISSVPSGYKSLCTQNLTDPTISNPSQSFDILKYNGITQSPRTVTGLGVAEPDLVWVKRTSSSSAPLMWDALRGTDKNLRTDTSDNETAVSGSANGIISNYAANGFIVKDGSGSGTNVGSSGTDPYVAWAWDCGSSNSQFSVGSLNSSVYTQDAAYAASSNFSGNTTNVVFNNMFNGIIGNENVNGAITFSEYGNSTETTWTAPSTINNITSLRIYVDFSGTLTTGAFEVNGTSYRSHAQSTLGAGNDGWVTISETSLSSIKFGRNYNNNVAVGVGAVEVNGKILIDTNLTPPSFPSIASTVRANQSTGCSIVTYTGTQASGSTVAHGLNKAPEFWVMKSRSGSGMWVARHKDVANTHYMQWDDTANARNAVSDVTGDDDATSLVIPIGAADANNNSQTYVAYCWTPIPGFSAMGKYDGNSSADGPFVYTGFRPAWIMIKNITTSGYPWHIYDDKRDGFNFENLPLYVDLPDQQGTTGFADILSNGFKIRNGSQVVNTTNDDYIWMAFASNPFKTARAR